MNAVVSVRVVQLQKLAVVIGGLMLLVGANIPVLSRQAVFTGTGFVLGLAFAQHWLLLSGAACCLLGLATLACRRLLPMASESVSRHLHAFAFSFPHGRLAAGCIVVGCAALTLAFDGTNFFHGFFRLDDFEILRVARDEPLLRQLVLANGDHSMPLFRVEVAGILACFGPSAGVFNLLNFAACSGLVAAGCWLLAETGARSGSLAVFAIAAWAWPGWGDFTEGYYTLSIYVQSAAFGVVALAALIRGTRKQSPWWFTVCALGIGAAVAIDLSGAWIFPAVVAFFFGVRPSAANPQRFTRVVAIVLGVPAFGAIVFNVLVFRAGGFLSMSGGTIDFIPKLSAFISGMGGLVLSLLIPLQVGSLHRPGLIHLLVLAALMAAAALGVIAGRRCSSADRRVLAAITVTFFVCVGMIACARQSDEPGFFWPPKWTAVARVWLVLWLAFCLDRLLFQRVSPASMVPRAMVATLVVIVWLSITASHCALAIHAPQGRLQALARAQGRQADFQRLLGTLTRLSARCGQNPLVLPPPSSVRFDREFPQLAGYTLAQLYAAAPRTATPLVVQPGAFVPEVERALPEVPQLARIYCAP